MKNSKIFDIIKKSGQAFTFNMGREQWLSDGAAAYSLAGLPKFSKETLLCMLDQDDTFPITMDAATVIDVYADEKIFDAEMSNIIIKWKKNDYILVRYDINRGFFVNYKYIKDFYRDIGFIFKVRKAGRFFYLAVYDGMIPVAAVMPAAIIDTGFENRIGEIADVVNLRMREAVESALGMSVPEQTLIGTWQNMSGEAEQVEI